MYATFLTAVLMAAVIGDPADASVDPFLYETEAYDYTPGPLALEPTYPVVAKAPPPTLMRPDMAAYKAAIDLTVPPPALLSDRYGYRYLWVPDGSVQDHAIIGHVINSVVSRVDVLHVPSPSNEALKVFADGKLVRVDLRAFARDEQDLARMIEIWDKLPSPYFLVTAPDGTRVFGDHVSPRNANLLQTYANCRVPIVWCVEFYVYALTTLDNGLYYDFLGINEIVAGERQEGQTDEDLWLASLGIDREFVDNIGAEQRSLLSVSQITQRPRRIDMFTRPSRPGFNQGFVAITEDVLEGAYDPAADPVMNLYKFQSGGKEIVYERNNGHLGYLLFNGAGVLQSQGPDTLVADWRTHGASLKRLEPGISCLRCHGDPGESGWKPFENVVPKIAKRIDIFADQAAKIEGLDQLEAIQKLSSYYQGKLDKPLRRAREDHEEAVTRSIPAVLTPEGDLWSFQNIASGLAERFKYYRETPVTSEKACLELGIVLPVEADPAAMLREMLGDGVELPGTDVAVEDIRLGMLLDGEPITRRQWEVVFIDACRRYNARQQLGQVAKTEPDGPTESSQKVAAAAAQESDK